jgi:hypothetical protein
LNGKYHKEILMDKDYLNILVLDHTPFGIRRLRVKKESFRIGIYLLAFFQLAITFFLCDYIQVKKKNFLLNQLRQESQVQRSQIQLFSANIEELEKKLSKLRDVDRRIRTIANLERGHEAIPFIGMGGLSPSVAHAKSKEVRKASEPSGSAALRPGLASNPSGSTEPAESLQVEPPVEVSDREAEDSP